MIDSLCRESILIMKRVRRHASSPLGGQRPMAEVSKLELAEVAELELKPETELELGPVVDLSWGLHLSLGT